jgi:hypothetical protein
VGVRVIMAAVLATVLLEGGARAAASPNATWFYTGSGIDAGSALASRDSTTGTGGSDSGLSSVQLLSRFVQNDTSGAPVAVERPLLFGGRDFEVAAPVAPNIALGFGSRLGSPSDFADTSAGPGGQNLFLNAADLMQPFSQTGREVHAQSAIGLADGLSLNFGESSGASDTLPPAFGPAWMQAPLGGASLTGRTAETGFAGLNWNVAPWANVALVARQGNVQASAPGSASLSLAKASTQSLGVSGHLGFGSGWVTSFSYNEGVTQLDLRPADNLLAAETAHGRSFGVAIAKHGLFGDDALGLAVSRPPPLSYGSVDLGDSPTADPFDGFISSATRPILGGTTPETDLQLGYVTTFLDGALALQTNAGYQMNTAGQSGNNGVAVLSRAKINF